MVEKVSRKRSKIYNYTELERAWSAHDGWSASSSTGKWGDLVDEAHLEGRMKDSKNIVSWAIYSDVILQTMGSHYDIKKEKGVMQHVFQKGENDRNVSIGMESIKTMKVE